MSLLLMAAALPVAGQQERPTARPASSKKARLPFVPAGEYVPGQLLVRFREDSPVLDLSVRTDEPVGASRENGGVVLPVTAGDNQQPIDVRLEYFGGSELVPGLRLGRVADEDTLTAIAALAAREDVLYAEPDYIYHKTLTPNDPQFPNQYALERISAPAAWDITTGSQSVVVGIVDSGFDTLHEDLRDNVWTNPGDSTVDGQDNDGNGFIDDVNGWDFFHNDRTVFDSANEDDHGTHTAGTVGARGNNGRGVTGVNWQVSLMSIKVLGGAGGSSQGSSILNGLNYARTMKQRGVNLRVLNNSYGGGSPSNAVRNAIEQLSNAGIFFVAAAGNGGEDDIGDDLFTFPHFPSSYDLPNVVAVASTNSPDNLSGFSNFGARVVSMGAPGSGILSTTPRNYSQQTSGIFGLDGSTYSSFSGTSMATPHVAGAAALVVAAKPNITMQELKGVLAYSGDPLPSLADKTTTGRRLNVHRAIQSALENDTTAPAPAGNLQITSQNGRTLNLSWTAPGDDGTGGTAADYDFFFVNSANGTRTLLPTSFFPAAGGSVQTASVNVPLRSFQGTLEIKTYDNAGNSSTASIPVNVPVNPGSDPYVVSQSGGGGLSTGGTRLNLNGDDKYLAGHTLPFVFPFFGQQRNVVTISSNGNIYFSTPPRRADGDADDVPGTVAVLRGSQMIAGLWDDLMIDTTKRADAGIFEVRPSADRVIYRWQATTFNTPLNGGGSRGEHPVNFEIELKQDGTIIFRYGDGNTNLFPVVGVSAGEPEPYVVESHTSENALKSLTNAPTVTFAVRTAAASTFQFSAPNFAVNENAGQATITVTRAGDTSGTQAVTFATETGGTATDGSDYQSTGARLVFGPGETTKTHNVLIINDSAVEPDETVRLMLHTPENGATLGSPAKATLIIRSEDQAGQNSVQFSTSAVAVAENAGKVTITVTRSGADTSNPATVFYQTINGSATDSRDYNTALGLLRFAAGDTSESFDVFITDDRYDDDNETFNVTLSDGTQTSVGAQNTITVTIQDNDAANAFSPVRTENFESEFFVKQHYVDFFNREADAGGLAFWKNQIDECGSNFACFDARRQNVSAAFFVSIEFQETGYLVYRTYEAAYNTGETLPFRTFLFDTQGIGRGVVIGQPGSNALLAANKVLFFNEFVARPEFLAAYPLSMSNAQFVDSLNANSGNVLTTAERDALVAGLDNLTETRATALRKVAEKGSSDQFNRAFVYMEYVGYLRRQPDAGGFQFWLGKLLDHNGNYITSEMVRSFIVSGEYFARFGNP